MSAFDKQVGGGHYKDMDIQPTEFIERNKLSFLEGCIVKRICRWRKKDGIKDLEKIKHEVDMLIEMNFEDVPAECPHGHGNIMRRVLKYTEGDDDERTQRQSDAQSGEGDERGTHTTVSEQHERGYTIHATDLAPRG